jgi:hypothetical protein
MRSKKARLLIAAALVAASTGLSPGRADAQGIHVDIGIPLPSISFHVTPHLVALPGTYAYVVPDYDGELFFYDGFWWRPYEGRWYRSSYYDRGWEIYGSVPIFYSSVPRDWRTRYHNHDWDGRRWDYERVSYNDVQKNWSSWKRDRYWDRTVRSAGEPDYRHEKSRSAPNQRIEDTRSGSDRRIEQNSVAPERTIEKKSSARPDNRVERQAPSQRSDRGPARTEKTRTSDKGASKARGPGGDHGGGKGKGGQGEGHEGGQGKGKGNN